MSRQRWARMALRLVSPAATLLLLWGVVRGAPCQPRAAPYLLGAAVAAGLWLEGRARERRSLARSLWAVAALWLALVTALWQIEATHSTGPGSMQERVLRSRRQIERRFQEIVSALDRLHEAAAQAARQAAGEAAPSLQSWRDALSALRPGPDEGLALYDAESDLVAWSGASMPAEAEFLLDATSQSTSYTMSLQGRAAHFFAARRVDGDWVLVSERRIESAALTRAPLLGGPHPLVKVEFQELENERRAWAALFSSRDAYQPRGPTGRALRLFPLRAPDGAVLAVASVHDPPLYERQAATSGRWRDVALIGLVGLAAVALRRLLVGFPALSGTGVLLSASLLIWSLRWLLDAARFPHLPLLRPLFDYTDYSSPLLGDWSRTPGDLLLTTLAALLQASILYAASGALARRRRCPRWRTVAGRIGLLMGGAAAAAGLWALVRSLARDARPLLLEAGWRALDARIVLLQLALFAGASALALGLMALGRWACRRCLARPEARSLGALSPGRRLVLLGLLGIVLVTLAYYPPLVVESEAARRRLVRIHLLPELLNQGWRREVVLRESLRRVLQEPEVVEALRAGPQEVDAAFAYRIWSETEMGALGYESSLRLLDAQGRLVSRFGLNMPGAYEDELRRAILAGPGPARLQVQFASIEKPLLFGRRLIHQGDSLLGGVEIVISEDYDNVPFIFASNPYTLLFRSRSSVLAEPDLLGAPPHFAVYDAQTLAPLFSTAPSPAMAPASAGALQPGAEAQWHSIPHGRRTLRMLYARRGDEIFAVGYERENSIRLAAGWLEACLQNVLLAALVAAALAPALAPAALRRALRDLRPRAAGQTFYRRLLVMLLLASLAPLLALTVFLEGVLAHEVHQEVQRLGTTALTVSRRVVADALATLPPGHQASDNLLFWLSQATRQDIHMYRGAALHATSRRELFSSGLVSPRLNSDVYHDLMVSRLGTSLRQEQIGDRRFYLISARITLPPPLAGEWIVSLPLGLQQEELEDTVREVREAVLLSSALLLVLLAILSYFVARRTARPLAELAAAAERVAGGDLEVRVERRSEAEFQALIDVFNRMANAIRLQQEDLRARGDTIEKILLNATTGVISCDVRGRVVTANPSARALTGAALEPGALLRQALERAGLQSLAAVLPASPADGARASGQEFVERREEVVLGAGAEERRLRAVLVPLRENDAPAGALLLLEDITENVRSNRLRAWAEMAQRIAHEIKNPLTPIQLSAEHLRHVYRDRPADFERVLEECLQTITAQVRALRQIAREFSTYARIPETRRELVDVREVIEEALTPYAVSAPPGLHIERCWADSPVPARVDRALLRRALVNLLENSLEALGGKGTIRVGLQEQALNGARHVRLTVDDDGPGVDPAILPRLFEPFFSTKGSGTGLGLAIARQAVEANGGGITVERPEGGRGTRMVILLPGAEG